MCCVVCVCFGVVILWWCQWLCVLCLSCCVWLCDCQCWCVECLYCCIVCLGCYKCGGDVFVYCVWVCGVVVFVLDGWVNVIGWLLL